MFIYDNSVLPPVLKQQMDYKKIIAVEANIFDFEDKVSNEDWSYKFTLKVADRDYCLLA